MTIHFSQLAPFIWAIAAVLVIIIVVIAIKFFWQHILKFLLHGCAVIVAIIAILVLLHYLKVF
ncbi:MAG: hypothetical protein ABIF04_07315 [Chloroflexota bacterium]